MNDHKAAHRPHQIALDILARIYDETIRGRIAWERLGDADYSARVSDDYSFPISFDFQTVESHPTPVTSRAFVNLRMPGMNQRYFNGTEGYDLLYSLLLFIETGDENLGRYDDALAQLESALSETENEAG